MLFWLMQHTVFLPTKAVSDQDMLCFPLEILQAGWSSKTGKGLVNITHLSYMQAGKCKAGITAVSLSPKTKLKGD